MTHLFTFLILLYCGQVSVFDYLTGRENSVDIKQTSEDLKTGWYYLTDSINGIERTLIGTEEIYYVDPNPIVTIENFTDLEIYQSSSGDYGLTIKLDNKGAEQWSFATGKSIGHKLALIIDNELYYTPKVNAQIDVGITALNREGLTEGELKEVKKKIENEKKAKP